MADVGFDVGEDLDVVVTGDGCVARSLVTVDGHLDLSDAALADETSPDEGSVEGLVFGDCVALLNELEKSLCSGRLVYSPAE